MPRLFPYAIPLAAAALVAPLVAHDVHSLSAAAGELAAMLRAPGADAAEAGAIPAPARADTVIERTLRVGDARRLTLDFSMGADLQVTAWTEEKVRVQVRQDARCGTEVEFDEGATGIEVRSRGAHGHDADADDEDRDHDDDCHLRVSASVPARFDLRLRSMGGDVAITGVTGDIRGTTMGGALRLARLGGTIDLRTMGGDIELADSRLDGEVRTNGGEVTFRNVSGGVRGNTMGGNVRYLGGAATGGIARTAAAGERELRVRSMGGAIQVDEAPAGADVSTMGGDVHLRRAAGFVRAKTMGGSIRLDAVDGAVRATTMAGEIEVTIVGDPAKGDHSVDLDSYSGNITLVVPDGLAATFDVQIASTSRDMGAYEIESDFPLTIRAPGEWDRGHGTARHYITGTGTVGAGTNAIKIRTINGNIAIRRGGTTPER